MHKCDRALLLSVIIFLIITGSPALATWPGDGVPVCLSVGDQNYPRSVSDGAGGAIIAWEDPRDGDMDIYVQWIDASGTPRWASGGKVVCDASGDQEAPEIVSDGAGGTVIIWRDHRSGIDYDYDIYAQRIDASGTALWGNNGLLVCSHVGGLEFSPPSTARLVPDGSGGAVIAWHDYRSASWDIYAQRIDALGKPAWTGGGEPICTSGYDTYDVEIVSDGSGGAIICWEDGRSGGSFRIYAQRIDTSGFVHWTLDGIQVNNYASSQLDPAPAADGAGGMIVAWRDTRSGQSHLYAQKIASDGFILWSSGGEPVCTVSGYSIYNPWIEADGAGGAFIAWRDQRSGDYDVYMQRILDKGTAGWAVNGIPVCAASGSQWINHIVRDGAEGVLVAWTDYRTSTGNIYVQKVDDDGTSIWTEGGIPVCPSEDRQDFTRIVSDGAGGIISCWVDQRNFDDDIYAQMTDFMGRAGYLPPVIRSVADIPGDQGGSVRVMWDSSPLDYMSGEITFYSIWRSIETVEAMAKIDAGNPVLRDPGGLSKTAPDLSIGDAAAERPSVLRSDQLTASEYYWELVTTLETFYFENYAASATTYFDSTAACDDYHYFQVVAHTSSPAVFWVSEVDSGYSVDNIAPAMPLNLSGTQSFSPIGLWLTWDPNNEADLGGYYIYRGTESTFVPGPVNLLNTTTQPLVLDEQWTWESGYWYKVAAFDVHDNLSEFAVIGPDALTGDLLSPVPDRTYLAQNYPNPFNPTTTISFGVDDPGHVSLKIYDTAGRLVRTLADRLMDAGQYKLGWNGISDDGSRVSSGIYFYRLKAADFEETRKMVLLR